MGNESVKLAMSFSKEKIRLIEAEDWDHSIRLTSVVQIPSPGNFDFSAIGNQKRIPQFADVIDKSLENFSSNIKSAKVAIDRKFAIKKTFLVDKGFLKAEISNHIEWELEQLLIAPRDEYNVGFEHVNLPDAKYNIVVFAAIRRSVIKYIEEIFKKSRIALDSVDLDVFSSIRAVNVTLGENKKGANTILDFSDDSVGLTILYNGNYALSSELSSTLKNKRYNEQSLVELVTDIDTELKNLLSKLAENIKISALSNIFIVGEKIDQEIIPELQKKQLANAVSILNPFQNIQRQLNVESQMLIDEHSERFLPCLGMLY